MPPRPGVMCDIGHAIMSQADGKRVILSPTGETWIDIGAERVGIKLDFGLLTFLKDGKWGLVDTAGQVMVEPQFDEPVYFAGSPARRRLGQTRRQLVRHRPARRPCARYRLRRYSSHRRRAVGRFECKVEP